MRKQPDSQPDEKDLLLAYHIKELREQTFPGKGSVQRCADKIGTSLHQYYTWENASRTPRGKNLEKIEKCYGVPREYFSRKPDNWKSIYDKMLERWKKRVGAVEPEIEESDEAAGTVPTAEQALATQTEVNRIIRLLVEKQKMAEDGEIDAAAFNDQLRDAHKYMQWSFSK